jgi:hypothetical protein
MKKQLRTIFKEWDPMGLFRLGCPEDEYELEEKMIEGLLPGCPSEKDLKEALIRILTSQFYEKDWYLIDEATKKIWQAYQEEKQKQ